MKTQIFSKQFTLTSPFPPDEVIVKLKEQIATSYPYYAKGGKPYRGRVKGYSFEMQKIDETMRDGWSRSQTIPVKVLGKIEPDGNGSIIKVTTGNNIGLVVLLIFVVVSLLGFTALLVRAGSGVMPVVIALPAILFALAYNQANVDVANTKTFLHMLLKGGEVSNI